MKHREWTQRWIRSRKQQSRRNPAAFPTFRSQRSEPLGAASVGAAVPIVTVAVEVVIATAVVAVPVAAAIHHAVLEAAVPAYAAAEPMPHMSQGGETPLLAVVQRLVERIGRIRDFLHPGRLRRHVVGAVAQARARIMRLPHLGRIIL